MHLAKTAAAVREQVRQWRDEGERIALAPTMGNLHRGHLELVSAAHRVAGKAAVSVFVNPLQFDRDDDFNAYPRTLERDLRLLERHGADMAFAPEAAAEVCPPESGALRRITAGPLGDGLCGAHRPGHFDGVAVAVAALFDLFRPDAAVFGEKDYQQLCIVRDLAARLGHAMEIVAVPTVREADGLAMSSRNAYLTPREREQAPALYRVLQGMADAVRGGADDFAALAAAAVRDLGDAGLRPEYVEIRRADTLRPATPGDQAIIVLAAAWLGRARLIDNIRV